ncbi:hypothetical protein F3Y22_tig00113725pilonHSYRG01355 [Hibiscus syriacus]|uniref:NAD-dependent epimerase/dehydratase domain-containing protein n=1 Tax=Hibiscus syriacus TaxID=106335 RepID=A0A6A2XT92_HIBSY|nr:hypothetical protein F3Y22_tig00113725pilonHSYRG01355 [Hibiscus syriacus]
MEMGCISKVWYVLAKTLAEKATWKFCNDNNIDLVTVLPTFVIGLSVPPDLCSTASDVLALLKGMGGWDMFTLLMLHFVTSLCTSTMPQMGDTYAVLWPVEEMFDDCVELLVEQGLLSLHAADRSPPS